MTDARNKKPKVRLLIVDDRRLGREALSALFATVEDTKTEAGAAGEIDRLLDRFTADVALVCIGGSNGRPAEVVGTIRERCPAARVVMLDEAVRPAHVCLALNVGADGYWTKGASFDQLLAAVRQVAGGKRSFCPASRKHAAQFRGLLQSEVPAKAEGISRLSPRETEILVLLAKGLSVKQCADRLRLSPNTIDNHKSRTMKKLGVRKVTDLVRLAVQQGLV